jgi:hypothetical protein
MDKKLQKMEKKLAAASGLQVCAPAAVRCFRLSRLLAALQVAAGVAKKTPADKQLQRDAKAIVKKSMVDFVIAFSASVCVSGCPPLI